MVWIDSRFSVLNGVKCQIVSRGKRMEGVENDLFSAMRNKPEKQWKDYGYFLPLYGNG